MEGRTLLGTLSTHILPPINSTRRLLMASPSPVPPNCRVVEASAWLKDLNRRAIRSAGMPMPVSRTEKWSCQGPAPPWTGSGRRKRFDLDDDLAGGGEFDAVAEQVDEHLAQPGHVAEDLRRHAVVHLVGQVELLFRRLGGQQIQGVLDARAQVEGLVLQFELAGFDLGEIQDVVDDGEEGFAAGVDGFHVTALLGGQGRLQEQAGHGDDAVHGGADFVAHVGQELGLGAGGGFGGEAGGEQFPVGLGQFVLQVLGAQGGAERAPAVRPTRMVW